MRQELEEYKIIFLSAGAGWGKSTAVRECLKGRPAVYLTVEPDRVPRLLAKESLIVLDDFHRLAPRLEKRMAELIRRSPKRQRLILLSRCPPPEFLLPYRFSGELRLLTEADLALGNEEILQLANAWGASLPGAELRYLQHESQGYPPYIGFLLDRLAVTGLCTRAVEEGRRQLYAYFDAVLFQSWDKRTRRALMCGSFFSTVTTALMEEVLEEPQAEALLLEIARRTGMLQAQRQGRWRYAGPALSAEYLRWKAERELAPGEIQRLHRLGGDWCRTHGDYTGAVGHYLAAGSWGQVSDVLIQAVRSDGRAGTLCRLSDCLDRLSEEEIQAAPELSFAMSRVAWLRLDPGKARYWRDVLEQQAAGPEGRRAAPYLAYLDFCLPRPELAGRGALSLPKAAEGCALDVTALTAGLPSVLRGEGDLSALFQERELPAAADSLTGGFMALLQAEYRMEQEEGGGASLLGCHLLQLQMQARGALELEFVCMALTARALCGEGQFPEAASYLLRFRQRAEAAGDGALLANIDALRCRVALLEDSLYAAQWLAAQPPTGGVVSLVDGYCLLTRVRCHIKREEYRTALLYLGPLLTGYARCGRILDQMEALILTAICLYRLHDRAWRDHLERALRLGAPYRFVRVFTGEGAAILPLLEDYPPAPECPVRYWSAILRGAASQAGHSPAYLRPDRYLAQPLTPAEHMVMTLLVRHKSTGEMARIMGVKVSTVRTHLRHLFVKLGVHSQEEARKAAVGFHLV